MRARAPASAANLGPGFDALAVALALYTEVTLEPSDELTLVAADHPEIPPSEHLGVRVAREVLGHDHFTLTVTSEIPISRGLGSSAALALSAAAAAGSADPLAVAAHYDGHRDNAAAAFVGGLVAAAEVDGAIVTQSLSLDPIAAFVIAIPTATLSTSAARAALPTSVSLADASYNLARLGLLLGGLADVTHLRPAATGDRLHQPHRDALFPMAVELRRALMDGGCLAACWSGAGSTMLGVTTTAHVADVATRVAESLAASTTPCEVRSVLPDRRGLVTW